MKLTCAPSTYSFQPNGREELNVLLYNSSSSSEIGSIGSAVMSEIFHRKLQPEQRAWDLLSIALAVISADLSSWRKSSPDGWTRQFEVNVAVNEPDFWNSQKDLIERQFQFLTTDIWNFNFIANGQTFQPQTGIIRPPDDGIILLSGGLDSLIGAVDLAVSKKKLFGVSQIVRGDREKQSSFAKKIGGGMNHIQMNHNAAIPGQETPPSQRARSAIFLAYGVLIATSLNRYKDGGNVNLYVCENGFISINPPLTGARLGSLSTRTAHPVFLNLVQQLLDAAELRVKIDNPYQFKTKGEMMKECLDQDFLKKTAYISTSCGRFGRMGYKQCGRCVPCLIRRAAFNAWGVPDSTEYVYRNLSKDDEDHGRFDDVRSAAMAFEEARINGMDNWFGLNLNSLILGDVTPYKEVAERGINEVGAFLKVSRVK
jgi:7-cyano-7-deazaguanine synthase in queuosine biosynthesis